MLIADRPITQPKPLSIVLTSSGNDVITPGTTFTLGVTIHNLGQESAIIYAYIEERSANVRHWCSAMQERLALAADQSGELTFTLSVPSQALPEVLEYDLVIDASDAYPALSPIRYEQRRLQILAADLQTVEASDPIFSLGTQTAPEKPAIIQPAAGLPVEVWVENRSDRVDRFRLSCSGLPDSWTVSIDYPRDHQGLGLVRDADSLGLNPGDRGQILLTIIPPAQTIADIYVPTIRLTSQNTPTLNCLELLYLQVNPTYLLQSALQILRNQVRTDTALFELQLVNAGNTLRSLSLEVQNLDEPESCQYVIDHELVTIAPYSTRNILLRATPQRWWKRPFYGAGRLLNFRVNLQDTDNHPLLVSHLQGNLSWMARPWWQLLLLALLTLALLGSAVGLIWWRFLRIPPPPAILNFEASDRQYSQANEEFARIDWQIERPEAIAQIQLTGYTPEGDLISGPLIYDLARKSKTLPAGLAPFCIQQRALLTCNNLLTDASKPSEYIFELTLIPRNQRHGDVITQRTDAAIAILPKPLPTITDFAPTSNRYHEQGTQANDPSTPVINSRGILVNWRVENTQNLQALKLVGRTQEGEALGEIVYPIIQNNGQPELADSSLNCQFGTTEMVCQNVPTNLTSANTYQFDLVAIPVDGLVTQADSTTSADPTAAPLATPNTTTFKTTDEIIILPRPPIIARLQINGQPAAVKYVLPIGQKSLTLDLSWIVEGGATTEVKLLPAPGPVPLQGNLTLPIKPESGSTTLTLQAKNSAGQSAEQSIVIETYDPTPPVTAEEVAAAAAAAAAEAAAKPAADAEAQAAGNGAGAAGANKTAADGDAAPGRSNGAVNAGGRLSPTELPPRFN